jgi:hypothetical protein
MVTRKLCREKREHRSFFTFKLISPCLSSAEASISLLPFAAFAAVIANANNAFLWVARHPT